MLSHREDSSVTDLSLLSCDSFFDNDHCELIFKFILIGDTGVGKTSILQRYTKNKFMNEYRVTVGAEFGSKSIDIDDLTRVKLQIWDTAGQESFLNIVRSFYRGSQGVFFIYNINKRKTFENLSKWRKEVADKVDPNAILILIGNQVDLNQRQGIPRMIELNLYREVTYEEGVEMMTEYGMHFFFETSAQSGTNIELAFTEAARLAFLSYLKAKLTGKGTVFNFNSTRDDVISLSSTQSVAERKTIQPENNCAC